jgi:Ubiquitin carboxyl-terminal hydrolase
MCIYCGRAAQVKREAAINKRVALAQLPPTLVLHLNRFFLDLDTFSTVKLNTAFEFPRRLNVEGYTKEGLAWREGLYCITVVVTQCSILCVTAVYGSNVCVRQQQQLW